jgi:hypothetical protein
MLCALVYFPLRLLPRLCSSGGFVIFYSLLCLLRIKIASTHLNMRICRCSIRSAYLWMVRHPSNPDNLHSKQGFKMLAMTAHRGQRSVME